VVMMSDNASVSDAQMHKVLPMNYPPITSYPLHANLLSIVTHDPDSYNWIYNYYIQLEVDKEMKFGARLEFCSTMLWKSCPFIYYQRMSRDFITQKWGTITNFAIDCIHLDTYVCFNINKYYISAYDKYREKHVIHDIFVYGYDKKNNQFHVADNFVFGKYSYEVIPFEELEEGYNQIHLTGQNDWMDGVEFIKYRQRSLNYIDFNHEYTFDPELAAELIEDYLNGENTLKKRRIPSEQFKKDLLFGMDIYSHLQCYYERFKKEEVPYDIRPLHVLWDHKKMMVQRIQYMGKRGFLKNAIHLQQKYQELENQALILRNLLIAYSLREDNKYIVKIIKGLGEIASKEKPLLVEMLDNIVVS
jgi:hypothetical protein